MKIICCDICGSTITPGAHETSAVCIPEYTSSPFDTVSGTVVHSHADVCMECRRTIADCMEKLSYKNAEATKKAMADMSSLWHGMDEKPGGDGRFLVADNRFCKPHVSIAVYDFDNDEWITNAAITPEDLVYWMEMPKAPQDMETISVERDDADEGE